MTTAQLPIFQIKDDFCQALSEHTLITLAAPPGAGKSTALPLWLLELTQFSDKKIIMLQPRRLATLNVARYLAKQLGEQVGETIGYRMRNDTKVSSKTRLEVVTEGILTRMIQQDPELEEVSLILFDEFHERSLHADLAFALSRDIQQGLRDDLTLVLMSATLDNDYITRELPDAVQLVSEGRSYPIDVSYQPPANSREWRAHAEKVIVQFCHQHQGSVLVFLPGVSDIKYLADALADKFDNNKIVCPLYGGLDIKAQQQAIQPAPEGTDKIVLSTNVAETSLTIEGINAVIDCGLEKVATFNSNTLVNQLQQKNISKASAIQRAGRAGRLMAGQCIRLFSQDDFNRRSEQAISEIKQADLLPLLIEVAKWGVSEPEQLPFIEQPDNKQVKQGWQTLIALELCDERHKLTPMGEQVATLSTHPRFAHAILKAKTLTASHVLTSACLLAALLEERDIYHHERARFDADLNHRLADLIFYIEKSRRDNGLYNRIIEQAKKLCKQAKGSWQPSNALELTGVLLAFAFPERIAMKRPQAGKTAASYLCANGQGVQVDSDDPLSDQALLVFAELGNAFHQGQQSQRQQRLQAKRAATISQAQLNEYFNYLITDGEISEFDEAKGQIIHEQQARLGSIILSRKPASNSPEAEQLAAMWSRWVKERGLSTLKLDSKSEQLLTRVRLLANYMPEADFPSLSEQTLLDDLSSEENWLSPYVGEIKSAKALTALNWFEIFTALLSYEQQQILKQHAPSHFTAPTGNRFAIEYRLDALPTVSLPLPQCYGLTETPRVANGKIALNLALLSPAKRPLQITHDLAGFWAGSYREVQKEMKGRYPKHYWPDDPANAEATTKTKKYM